ncbi:MAG: DUF4124 domain-containing protein [Desulfobacterales bacterium]|nr:DUF4124 domain-containing protein [Desulfobacterales bacterium]
MVRKVMRAWVLIGALILLPAVSPSDAKEVYKWVDEKGTVHFSEDGSSVPEKYREQIEKKSVPEEAKGPEEKVKFREQDGKGAKDRLAVKEKEKINKNRIEGDVVESVKTILSLWKDGKYNELYDRGDQKSRRAISREDFEYGMRKKGIGLASSWETLRDIQVDVEGATLAFATVRIGLKPTRGGETKFRTETYRMPFEKGMWKINLKKILQTKI